MKRVSLLLIFILCLAPLCSMGMSSVKIPVASSVPVTSVSKNLWSTYLAPAIKASYAFVARQSKKTKIIAGTLGVATLAHIAYKAIARVFNPPVEEDLGVAEDFQDALNEWLDQEDAYEAQVEVMKRRLTFFLPAALATYNLNNAITRNMAPGYAAIDALNTGSTAYMLMRSLFDLPAEGCVRLLAHIPTPSFLSTLRATKVKVDNAWQRLKRIISQEEVTLFDLNDAAKQMRIRVDLKARVRNHISELSDSNLQYGQRRRAHQTWVGGTPLQIAELIEQVREYNDPRVVADRRLPVADRNPRYTDITLPRGVFMLGAPGVGKSFAAELIGQATGCYVDIISATDIFGMYVGDAKKNVKAIYKKAAERAVRTGRPAFVFIDEADSILGARAQQSGQQGHGAAEREALNTLLPLLDGPKAARDVVTIFASNMPRTYFDSAVVTRTKRVRYFIEMGAPGVADSLAMLRNAAEKYPQTRELLGADQIGILQRIAGRAQGYGFVADNLYGIIDQAVDDVKQQAVDNVARAYADQVRDHPGYQLSAAQLNDAKFTARRDARVDEAGLQRALEIIRERLPAVRDGVQLPAATPQGPAHVVHELPATPVGVPTHPATPTNQASAIPAIHAEVLAHVNHELPVSPVATTSQGPLPTGASLQDTIQQTLLQVLQRLTPRQPEVVVSRVAPAVEVPTQLHTAAQQSVGRPRIHSISGFAQGLAGIGNTASMSRAEAFAALRAGPGPMSHN